MTEKYTPDIMSLKKSQAFIKKSSLCLDTMSHPRTKSELKSRPEFIYVVPYYVYWLGKFINLYKFRELSAYWKFRLKAS